MKKGFAILLGFVIMASPLQVLASDGAEEPKKVIFSCYCTGTITYSGEEVHEGIIAADKSHQGAMAIVYTVAEDGGIGDYVGTYEVKDLMGNEVGRNGNAIDVYHPRYSDCVYDMRVTKGKCYVQYIWGDG